MTLTTGFDPRYCLHLKDGCLTGETPDSSCLRHIFNAYRQSGKRRMVLHFHGGLVPFSAGVENANSLSPFYTETGTDAYPVFFIWESGPLETVCNNLHEIAQEAIFQQFIRKVLEFALKKLGSAADTRGEGTDSGDGLEVKKQVYAWFSGTTETPPFAAYTLLSEVAARSADLLTEDGYQDEVQANLELDDDFIATVEAVAAGIMPVDTTRSATGMHTWAAESTAMSSAALSDCFTLPQEGQRGFLNWPKIAAFIVKLVIRVVKRYLAGRDHGLYATVEEEVLHTCYLAKLARTFQWNLMKQDTHDAFNPLPTDPAASVPAGSAFLRELACLIRQMQEANEPLPELTLVGHSAGAIFISHFLKAVAAIDRSTDRSVPKLPAEVQFGIILLAPAVDFTVFRHAIESCPRRIAGVRIFTMNDTFEQANPMAYDVPALRRYARWIYPHSLLYCISGVLEETADWPILGMERFYLKDNVFDEAHFPDVHWARQLFKWPTSVGRLSNLPFPARVVLSKATGLAGACCQASTHGTFDQDAPTLQSVQWLIQWRNYS